jgi:ADP-ribose pyrophosphatase YjhB (NUDIX family)
MHPDFAPFRFCPFCAAPLVARRDKPGEPERMACPACGFVHYLDPKVAVGTIIRRDGRLVLVRRSIEPGYGKWVYPGGYVDRGEDLEEAAVCEAREESGLEVRIEGLVNIYSYPGRTPVIIVYSASAMGGELRPDGDECLEAAEFEVSSIPWEELAFPSTTEALRDYLSGLLHRRKGER